MTNTPPRAMTSVAIIAGALGLYLALTLLLVSITESSVMGAIGANAVFFLIGWLWLSSTPRRNARFIASSHTTDPRTWVLIADAVVIIWLIVQTVAAWIYEHFGSTGFDQHAQTLNQAPVAITLLLTLIFAPIGEEMLMRGVIYARLREHLSPVYAALLSSYLFAALHGNLIQIALALPLGLLLANIYERSKSLPAAIAAHAVFNLLSVITPAAAIAAITSTGTALLGVAGLIALLVKLYIPLQKRVTPSSTSTQ